MRHSKIQAFGTEEDKANLPTATYRNQPHPEKRTRKRQLKTNNRVRRKQRPAARPQEPPETDLEMAMGGVGLLSEAAQLRAAEIAGTVAAEMQGELEELERERLRLARLPPHADTAGNPIFVAHMARAPTRSSDDAQYHEWLESQL